jgi:FKBP-type peptidyl-prolyl cis-trans isomerase
MHSGVKLLEDTPGLGPVLKRQRFYRIRLRMWLNKGEPIRWRTPWGSGADAVLQDEGQTLVTNVRFDRVFLIGGLFYGVEGMCVGGTRRLKISPHLGYGTKGLPGVVPPNSVLTAEITILTARELA